MADDAAYRRYERPTHTWRLTFDYDGEDVRLVARERVEMVPPPPEPDPTDADEPGVRVELRDAQDRVVYQRALRDPIQHEYEVFPQDPNEPPSWVPNDNPTGTFEVLVPAVDDADDVVLQAGPPPGPPEGKDQRARRPREMVRLRLRDEPPGQEA